MTAPEMMSPEGLWATARGFDLKAPHWDDLDEVTREQIRRIAATIRPTTAKMFERVDVPDTLKFDPAVVTALSPFLFAVDGSPLGQVKLGYLRDLSLASYEAGKRDAVATQGEEGSVISNTDRWEFCSSPSGVEPKGEGWIEVRHAFWQERIWKRLHAPAAAPRTVPPKAVEISAPFATITVDTKNIGNPRRGYHANRSVITFVYASTGHRWTVDREREIVTYLTAGGMWQRIDQQPDGSWVVEHGFDSGD